MISHEQNTLDQFDPQAHVYLTSAVHAAGPDLRLARELVARSLPATAVALDVGCGAGHLGFAIAPAVALVTVTDPSPAMVATALTEAKLRGIFNLDAVEAHAGMLPFEEARFCLVASRFSAHHWRDVPSALKQMRRVVKPGGYLLMIDALGQEAPLVDTHLQSIELLRDPSHVRDYCASQWRCMIGAAGFTVVEETRWRIHIDFAEWIARMHTPIESVAAVRALQRGAPLEVNEALDYEEDGSFSLDVGLFWARAMTG